MSQENCVDIFIVPNSDSFNVLPLFVSVCLSITFYFSLLTLFLSFLSLSFLSLSLSIYLSIYPITLSLSLSLSQYLHSLSYNFSLIPSISISLSLSSLYLTTSYTLISIFISSPLALSPLLPPYTLISSLYSHTHTLSLFLLSHSPAAEPKDAASAAIMASLKGVQRSYFPSYISWMPYLNTVWPGLVRGILDGVKVTHTNSSSTSNDEKGDKSGKVSVSSQ